jgi:hypothetical protein
MSSIHGACLGVLCSMHTNSNMTESERMWVSEMG